MNFEVDVASDLYNAGYTEDGVPFIAETYYVTVTNLKGRRWASKNSWKSAETYSDEYGDTGFTNVREEALNSAEDLAKYVTELLAKGKKLNKNRWYEIQPAYGSEEYVSQGIEELRCYEEKNGLPYSL